MTRFRFSLAAISSAVAFATLRAGSFASTVATAGSSLAQRLVASFDRDFDGPHPGFRANHAKGILCEGTFTPNDAAASLSVAAHFAHPVKASVRFSNFGGLPLVPDASGGATPHGLAVKFHLAGGGETDMVGHSVPFFPSATPEAFDEFLHALKGGAATLVPFASTRPSVARFIAGLKSPPVSFATIPYFFIDAFTFVDRAGTKRHVRYSMIPTLPEAYLTPERASAQSSNYLMDEIAARLKKGPITFEYVAQVANEGDPTHDPTNYWPSDRRTVTLGRLSVTAIVPNNRVAQQQILFDPARLTAGIELTDDPMVPVRSQAYAISFARRVQSTARRPAAGAVALGCPYSSDASPKA